MSKGISFKKELVCCFGDPIWDNPTEVVMEAAFQHHDMDYRYVTTLVSADNLKTAFEGLKAMGYRGFNCTIPHKVEIIKYLDGLGESAKIIQAVNCVVERDGKYIGENTDGKGFIESINTKVNPSGKRVLVFGAGGAARAVTVELALAGAAHITVVNRSVERGEGLLEILAQTKVPSKLIVWEGEYAVTADIDIVINCTSIGLSPDIKMLPVKVSSLMSHMVVCDLIVNPPLTPFLKSAQGEGCVILDGLGMLVNQGRIGIKYWSGVDVDPQVMLQKMRQIYS